MSSLIVSPWGSASVTVAATYSIAVYSKGPTQVYRRVGSANVPSADSLLGTVSNGQTVFGAYASGASIILRPGYTGCLYEVGLSPSVQEVANRWATNAAATALDSTGTLTGAMILGGVVTSSTAAAVTATLNTGTVMDTDSSWNIGDKVLWSVVNTGGSNTITVTADTGHSVIGSGAVAHDTSGLFETRKSAANTFVTTRLS